MAAALDVLEAAVGKRAFQRMFGLVLTDNGAEFSDWESLERSCLPGKGARCRVYYCDVRQSQQKGGCERNHVELRKLLPKRRGMSFDDLEAADMAAVMSQLNSEPRPSMAFMPPLRALLAAYGDDGAALTAALGVEEVPYGELLLGVEAVNRARAGEGGGSADLARGTTEQPFPRPVPLSPEAPRRGPAEPRAQIQPDGRPRPLAPYLTWGKGGRPLAGPSGYLGKRLLTAGRSAGFAIQPMGWPQVRPRKSARLRQVPAIRLKRGRAALGP